MHKYHDFWSVVLGDKPPGFILGYIFLGYIAAMAMIMILASSRDPNSANSPKEWSWRFFWVNNSIKFVTGFFLIPVFIRVAFEWLGSFEMLLMSIGIGFGFMGLAQVARKWGIFSTDKLSQRVTQEVNKALEEKQNKP